MSKTTAFTKAPSPTGGDSQPKHVDSSEAHPEFAAATLNMAWQLLFAVIIPVIGGALLDNALHTSPIFVLIGSALALAGTIVVIRRGVNELNWDSSKSKKDNK